MRADKSQTLYDAFQLWNWFVPWDNPITGTYFDKNWNFLIGTEPQASNFGNFYRDPAEDRRTQGHRDLPRHQLPAGLPAGPSRDVAGRLRNNPAVLDPSSPRSQMTPRSGDAVPAVNPDHCELVQPFGIWMNKRVEAQASGMAADPVHHLEAAPRSRGD